jgi:hypothetical protein
LEGHNVRGLVGRGRVGVEFGRGHAVFEVHGRNPFRLILRN